MLTNWFQFEHEHGSQLCTAERISATLFRISWEDDDTWHCHAGYTVYNEEKVNELVEDGVWRLVSHYNTPEDDIDFDFEEVL